MLNHTGAWTFLHNLLRYIVQGGILSTHVQPKNSIACCHLSRMGQLSRRTVFQMLGTNTWWYCLAYFIKIPLILAEFLYIGKGSSAVIGSNCKTGWCSQWFNAFPTAPENSFGPFVIPSVCAIRRRSGNSLICNRHINNWRGRSKWSSSKRIIPYFTPLHT